MDFEALELQADREKLDDIGLVIDYEDACLGQILG
jgi:hypothetical protein